MRYAAFFAFLLLIIPSFAGATGFAKESLFLSKQPVTEGEVVFIHAVVANDTNTAFTGKVVFSSDEVSVGTVAVTMEAGGAQAVSVSWKPEAGSRAVKAELTNNAGEVVEMQSATFSIQAQPQAAASGGQSSQSVGSSQDIQNSIAGLSPGVANAAKPVFATIDTLRQKSAEALDSGIEWAREKVENKDKGEVAGEATEEKSGIASTVLYLVSTLLLYLLTVLKALVNNAGLFYPVFAVVFLYFLWKIFRRIRRPSN